MQKKAAQRQGLIKLSANQVDELNKQFLSEVFEDPEVLHYV